MVGELESNGPSKTKHAVVKKTIRRHFQDYSENSTIHGIKYIGDIRRSIKERISWIVIFCASAVACACMIYAQWRKWQLSPVIVSFAETMMPIYDIPFPAITICPDSKSAKDVFNYTKAWQNVLNLTTEEKKIFEALSLTCDYINEEYEGSDTVADDLWTTLKKVSEPMNNVIDEFIYEGKQHANVFASRMFTTLLTSEGVCFTFNMIGRKHFFKVETFHEDNETIMPNNWSLEEGYAPSAGLDAYPNRASGGNQVITLAGLPSHRDLACTGAAVGNKIMLHNPAEMPRVKRDFIRVPLNVELTITVKPTAMSTSEGLRHYSPEKRKCYFATERKLHHFSVYTQNNCALECMMNNTVRICQCNVFYLPHQQGLPSCGYNKMKCVAQVEGAMLSKKIARHLTEVQNVSDRIEYKDCDCLPGCFDLQYNIETTQADYDWAKYQQGRKVKGITEENSTGIPGIKFTEVRILFKDMQFVTRHRSELFGYTDFLSNCGGLLGLFMGFSIISLVEIVYYCTVRVGCSFLQRGWRSRGKDGVGDAEKKLELTSPHMSARVEDQKQNQKQEHDDI